MRTKQIKVSEETHSMLKELAERENRKINGTIDFLLKEYLKSISKNEKGATK